eukprot:TRINITY_DN18716_c0_g1_i1.p1 TRINITY_DN18716_c0_g1~~TRINITY_DN18716_c0_g1_i1.p1  ORF type:complete len:618 (+),score=120.86 TRINITY_DN18716_c0_g1_i1:98-1951(+)
MQRTWAEMLNEHPATRELNPRYYWNFELQEAQWFLPKDEMPGFIQREVKGRKVFFDVLKGVDVLELPPPGGRKAALNGALNGCVQDDMRRFRAQGENWAFMDVAYLKGSLVPQTATSAQEDTRLAVSWESEQENVKDNWYHLDRGTYMFDDGEGVWKLLEPSEPESEAGEPELDDYYWNRITDKWQYDEPRCGYRWRIIKSACGGKTALDMDVAEGDFNEVGLEAALTQHEGKRPANAPPWLIQGAAVEVHGLEGESKRFNELSGTLSYFTEGGNAIVKLAETLGCHHVEASVAKIQPLRVGSKVIITKAALGAEEDGQLRGMGLIAGRPGRRGSEKKAHYPVCSEFDAVAATLRHPCDQLIPIGSFFGMALPEKAERLQWRKEQACVFIDSEGLPREINLQFPLPFREWWDDKAAGKPVRARGWPVLLALHGHGGGSHMASSKKSLSTEGLHYCGMNFLTVSPSCYIGWKKAPPTWMSELFRALRTLPWVDPERMYITGCSMGGMHTWEIGAALSDLAAAIAPVAAYQQSAEVEAREELAEKLKDMPILAVHSASDSTCPVLGEERLWRLLKQKGNERMQVYCAQSITHCSMWDRAYSDGSFLYEWLLRHRRPMTS